MKHRDPRQRIGKELIWLTGSVQHQRNAGRNSVQKLKADTETETTEEVLFVGSLEECFLSFDLLSYFLIH